MSSSNSIVQAYIRQVGIDHVSNGTLAYLASLSEVASVSPEVARSIVHELRDQRVRLKLIASENYCSLPTQLAMGNLLTDKYAEGFPRARFYEGCDNIDEIEACACEQAKRLFNCQHAYVQPHSGADANLIAYWAILSARIEMPALEKWGVKTAAQLTDEQWRELKHDLGNQRLLGMDLASGGHLTHGYRFNVSAKMFDAYNYGVSHENYLLDYDVIEQKALEVKPLILLAGYSSYPRAIDFRRMRAIADKVGAVFMVDMAHFAGLVAGKVFQGDYDPVAHAHVVTSTTHKTLRGPRGGIVLCTKEFAEFVDKGCPLVIGGPLPHMLASKAVAFTEANTDAFRQYASRIVENARTLAQACVDSGMKIVSGGTDNHLMLLDVTPFGITGRQAAGALFDCNITLNKNAIPFDPNGPVTTSGLRIGTPAITTLGMGPDEMRDIAAIIRFVLDHTTPGIVDSGPSQGKTSKVKYEVEESALTEARQRVAALLKRFTLYPELDLALMEQHFA